MCPSLDFIVFSHMHAWTRRDKGVDPLYSPQHTHQRQFFHNTYTNTTNSDLSPNQHEKTVSNNNSNNIDSHQNNFESSDDYYPEGVGISPYERYDNKIVGSKKDEISIEHNETQNKPTPSGEEHGRDSRVSNASSGTFVVAMKPTAHRTPTPYRAGARSRTDPSSFRSTNHAPPATQKQPAINTTNSNSDVWVNPENSRSAGERKVRNRRYLNSSHLACSRKAFSFQS